MTVCTTYRCDVHGTLKVFVLGGVAFRDKAELDLVTIQVDLHMAVEGRDALRVSRLGGAGNKDVDIAWREAITACML